MKASPCILSLLLWTLSTAALGQQYYRWVDANGTVHFSERPPAEAGTQAQLEQVRDTHLTRGMGGMSTAAGPASGTADSAAAAAEPVNRAPGSTTNQEMCQRVQANLATLQNNARLRRVDPDTGEISMMSAEQREQELARTQALADQYCGS